MHFYNIVEILFFLSFQTDVFCFLHKISKREVSKAQITKEDFHVKGVKDIFACNNGGCKDLTEFTINTHELPDCSEKSVKVEFDMLNQNNKTVKSHGYLKNGLQNPKLSESQETNENCRKIKRFYVNKKHNLIQVFDDLYYTEIKNSDNHILWELIKNIDLLTALAFQLGTYSEERDEILIWTTIKYSYAVISCTYVTLIIFIRIIDIYSDFTECVTKKKLEASQANQTKCSEKKAK